jgi:hypothetical protein
MNAGEAVVSGEATRRTTRSSEVVAAHTRVLAGSRAQGRYLDIDPTVRVLPLT